MKDFKKEAEAHWKYTAGIIKLSHLSYIPPNNYTKMFLKLAKYLYIQAMVHGYGHGVEDAKREVNNEN